MLRPLNQYQRQVRFGSFAFRAAPTKSNPEAIVITDGWGENLVTQDLDPYLAGLPGGDKVTLHKNAMTAFNALVHAWKAEGVLEDVLTWNGSYAARFVRGRPGILSSHAFGTAFDINAPWNPIGSKPAPLGTKGSVLRLVPIAERFRWAWGGHFRSRPDAMHFEYVGQ